jgi:pimeloyl-ACP methyl ester carboxylesterase
MSADDDRLRRRWRRRLISIPLAAGLACLLAVGVSGCTAASGGVRVTATAVASTLQTPTERCGRPAASGRIETFAAGDGVRLDGAEVGSGPSGVVLVHEYPADFCGFWPYAVYLSRHGLHVLDIDLRCFGESTCPPTTAARGDLKSDVLGAVAELDRHGARRVAVLGASLGGTVALAAAASPHSGIGGVVCLSCHAHFTPLVGGTPVHIVVGPTVHLIRCPALFIAGRDDSHLSPGEVETLYRDTGSASRHLEVLTGAQAAIHGWNLLTSTPPGGVDVASAVAAFLTGTTRPG